MTSFIYDRRRQYLAHANRLIRAIAVPDPQPACRPTERVIRTRYWLAKPNNSKPRRKDHRIPRFWSDK